MKRRIILIPSFGTDSSLYENLIPFLKTDYELLKIDWIIPDLGHGFDQYAKKLIQKFTITKEDILIGTSLGGIMAIEIQKIIEVHKIFSISSLLTDIEKPALFKILKLTKLYLLWTPSFAKATFVLIRPYYRKNIRNFLWFQKVFKASDNTFLKWSFRRLITWENNYIPENLVHIHGDKDPVFPIRNAKNINHIVQNGTHEMMRLKARQIADIINNEIE